MTDKKILDEEMLNDDQLEGVTGGSWMEFTADMLDAQKRGIAGFSNLNFDANSDLMKMIGDENLRHQYVQKVADLFAAHGIEMTYKGKILEKNIYKFNGAEISREEAWKIIDGK